MTVLVIAAHPDDEVLGCGATLSAHSSRGENVEIVFVADGEQARATSESRDVSARKEMACRAAHAMGCNSPHFLDLPDNRLDDLALLDVIREIEGRLREINARVVYTHHHGDLNIDHAIVQRAVMTALRPMPGSNIEAILGFEVMSATGWSGVSTDAFVPNYYVPISDEQFEAKMCALAAYEPEMRDFPHARSKRAISALAELRGAQVGIERAEAFVVYRQVARVL